MHGTYKYHHHQCKIPSFVFDPHLFLLILFIYYDLRTKQPLYDSTYITLIYIITYGILYMDSLESSNE